MRNRKIKKDSRRKNLLPEEEIFFSRNTLFENTPEQIIAFVPMEKSWVQKNVFRKNNY